LRDLKRYGVHLVKGVLPLVLAAKGAERTAMTGEL
jgi:hypothetical protein